MVTMAQRIEELRTEQNMSRPALAAALGFPKNALEKFETGRQSPTREQAQKLADFFGVSMFYLKGESNDRTRMDDWMESALSGNGTLIRRTVNCIIIPLRALTCPAQPVLCRFWKKWSASTALSAKRFTTSPLMALPSNMRL